MSNSIGLQFAFDITKALPVKEGLQQFGKQLVNIARDLHKSGSDIVVTSDLAELIGRANIEYELAKGFKKVVKAQRQVEFPSSSEIYFAQGAGPTFVSAMKIKLEQYMSSIIQLSLLYATHDRDQLAEMISNVMIKRSDAGFPDASPDPGYEAIKGTLLSTSC